MPMFDMDHCKRMLSENYPLLCILVGIVLVSLSIGPFQSLDTIWENEAVSGVTKWGMPYVEVAGNIMDQPPLGFYIEAAFFRIFGSSIGTGTFLITLFGLGSTILVYKIGKDWYGKSTGLFAAAVFGLAPWELVLSRTFLIDAQCLFFSLLSLYIGIFAIRKNSIKLAALSGGFFAAAFLTKLFAVYMLVPLLLLYIYYRPKNRKLIFSQIAAFCLPALLFSFLWYQVILGKGLMYLFSHNDFSYLNIKGVVPTYSFVPNFLINYGLGYFFLTAAIFSFLISFTFRKHFSETIFFEVAAILTIIVILSIDAVLGAGFNLKVPYTSAIKYDYQSLPFFSLAAASLVSKCMSLNGLAKIKNRLTKTTLILVSLAGLFLLIAVIFADFNSAHQLSMLDYVLFRVKLSDLLGYSFYNNTPTANGSLLMNIQYLGFAVVLFGFLWASRHRLHQLYGFSVSLFKPMARWIEAKNALIKREKD